MVVVVVVVVAVIDTFIDRNFTPHIRGPSNPTGHEARRSCGSRVIRRIALAPGDFRAW